LTFTIYYGIFEEIEYKGVEEKGAIISPFREVAVGASHRLRD
jgi:hypothetical protein